VVVDLVSMLPYRKDRQLLNGLAPEDALALCIYRGGPHSTLETYVRGKCVYRADRIS
jgi:hypothetical protein